MNPYDYLDSADLLFDEKQVRIAIEKIANDLNRDFDGELATILSVMNGALYFTGQLLPYLSFPVETDYVHATRYQGATSGHAIQWKAEPPSHVKGKKVLIIDDILDEGITLQAIVEKCKEIGATSVKTVVLVEKILAYNKPIQADFVGLRVENRYVFGCGMDVYGWWRNLPQIYALNDT